MFKYLLLSFLFAAPAFAADLPTGLAKPNATLTYVGNDSATVNTTSALLISSNTYIRAFQICTLPGSTSNVWLNLRGQTAVVNAGVAVAAGGGCVNFGAQALPIPSAAIYAINDGAGAQVVTTVGG